MKHTKEPWRVVSDVPVMAIYSEPEDYRVVQTVNQNNFNTYGKSRVDVGIYKQEDAERIVACVNACAGITNEVLEAGIVKGCIEIIQNQTPRPDDGIWRWMSIPVFDKEDV